MRDIDQAFRNEDKSAAIRLQSTGGRYRPALFSAKRIAHPRYGLIDLDQFGIVDTHNDSLMLTTYDASDHIASNLLATAAAILNEGLPLEEHDPDWHPGCDRFRIEDMPDSDAGPQICIVGTWPPEGVFPYLLYGLLGTRPNEITELTQRIAQGLNRRGYDYGN